MIRADREITDREQQLAILRDCDVCRIALNDPATGVPYIVPLNFGVDVEGDEVYLVLPEHDCLAIPESNAA